MKVPTSWNDKSLLKDEPFLTLFSSAYLESGKRVRDSALITRTTEELKGNIDVDSVVGGWIDHAFAVAPGSRIGRVLKSKDAPIIRLFVEIYLILSRGASDKALQILNRFRIARGFGPIDPTFNQPRAKSSPHKHPRLTSRHPLKSTDELKLKEAIKDNNVVSDRRSRIRTSKSKKSRPSSADTASLRPQKRPSNGNVDDRASKKRIVGVSAPLRDGRTSGQQVSREDRIGIPVSPSQYSANSNLRRSKRHANLIDEHIRRSEVVRKLKFNKLRPIQGPNQERITSEEANINVATLEVKQEPLNASPPKNISPLEIQRPQKRPPSRTKVERRSKRHRAAEASSNNCASHVYELRKTKERLPKRSTHNLEDKAANESNNIQSIKLEDLKNTSRISPPPPPPFSLLPPPPPPPLPLPLRDPLFFSHALDDECPRDDTPFVSSHSNQVYIPDKIKSPPPTYHTLPPPSLTSVPPEPRTASDSVETTSLEVSETEDLNSAVLLASPYSNEFPISTLQFPPEELPVLTCKAPLPHLPPIWAQSRQEVCESFDWFRSYQGGVYYSREITKGYLLSGFPSSRDKFEHGGRLIISHGGGKSESMHSTKGHLSCQPASDQIAQDKSIRALLNNYKNKRPLALLIDDKYALFPYALGSKDVTYAVLGFYTVESVWAEYQPASNESGRVVRYKFAFRWCEDQGQPWWDSMRFQQSPIHPISLTGISTESASVEETPVVSTSEPESRTCQDCQKESPRVFNACWVCLISECTMFWRQAEGPYLGHFLSGDLTYHPKFLELPPHRPLPFGFREIVTSLPPTNLTKSSRNYHFTRGFHCKTCGRLSCRSQWEQWQCLTCKVSFKVDENLRQAHELWNQKLSVSFKDYLVNPISDIVAIPSATFIHDNGRGLIKSFILPQRRGKIHHIQSGSGNGRKEADSLFLEYQQQAASGILKFRRWPLRAHKCRGPLLTNYFSHNAGEPYKYVGGDANTVPFESAPAACKSRDLIQKRIKQALGVSTLFNEVLSAAYMERQRMAFHSDNEIGLGPLVAGLSLGSPALMHFRLHGKYDPEREKRGILLSIVLRHGDVLVMDGADIQEYYEHTVVPNNFRIAATARQIGSTHHI